MTIIIVNYDFLSLYKAYSRNIFSLKMQLASYILLITTVSRQNIRLVHTILDNCFYCKFVVHGIISSWAVCEDVKKTKFDDELIYFDNYEKYLDSPFNEVSAITIRHYGELEDVPSMIDYVQKMCIVNDTYY